MPLLSKQLYTVKFVTCLQILLFLKKTIFCGHHNYTTLKWFKITNNSIIRSMCFSFNIKSDTFLSGSRSIPSPFPDTNFSLYYIDDPTKAPVTFRWTLNFYVKKYYCLLNKASWLAINKTLWTRNRNRSFFKKVF